MMLASGQSRRTAFISSVILGAATTLLGWASCSLSAKSVGDALPLSAGVTLYVAASDLIPEVNREPGPGMAVLVFVGVAVMVAVN